jgi:glycosyltransferase involved in cell wall biosynthesis
MKTCVLIPAYNEAKAIGEIIRKIRGQGLEIIVVDDGSQDNTAKIAQESGAIVLKNERNQGKGASLIEGFDYVRKRNFDAVITMDGDGQHLTEEIPAFINLAWSSNNGIIIGNRMSERRNMPLMRVWTNKFMSWLISKIARQRIPDTQCGFRLIKKEVLGQINLCTRKYETESEILIKSARAGFKIASIPIKTIYSGEKSQVNPFVDTLRFIRFVIRELWTLTS